MIQRPERTLARQCILSAIDGVLARLVFQADRFQRFDTEAPILITDEVTDRVSSVALALVRYGEGEYEAAVSLANIAELAKQESDDE
jgi:hypothetical protein